MDELEDLRLAETIIAFSYWENWDFFKSQARSLGGQHPRVKRMEIGVNEIREEWHEIQRRIKKIEDAKNLHPGKD